MSKSRSVIIVLLFLIGVIGFLGAILGDIISCFVDFPSWWELASWSAYIVGVLLMAFAEYLSKK